MGARRLHWSECPSLRCWSPSAGETEVETRRSSIHPWPGPLSAILGFAEENTARCCLYCVSSRTPGLEAPHPYAYVGTQSQR